MKFKFPETEERAQRVAYLTIGFINKTLTTMEHDELDEWVGENDDNTELFAQLTDERNRHEAMVFMRRFDKDMTYEKRNRRQTLLVRIIKKVFRRVGQRQ